MLSLLLGLQLNWTNQQKALASGKMQPLRCMVWQAEGAGFQALFQQTSRVVALLVVLKIELDVGS